MFRLALALVLLAGGVFYLLASLIPIFSNDAISFIVIGSLFLGVGIILFIQWIMDLLRHNERKRLAKTDASQWSSDPEIID